LQNGSFFVFVFVAIAILLITIGASLLTYQSRQQTLAQVADRFRGRLEYSTIFDLPRIRLRFEGTQALLRYTSHGKRGWHTHFQITWPDAKFRCELYREGMNTRLRRLMGMEDIQIGSAQFDQAFFITGNNVSEVRSLLSAEVQAIIFRLAPANDGLIGLSNVYVEFKGGVLTVTKPQHLATVGELDRFICLSAELYVAALRTRETGITFVEPTIDAPPPDATESQCQICGEPLAQDLVYCASCKTPSHRECWDYFGGCSTYACGGKKYLVRTRRKKAGKANDQ
jgi:hypothetical protein